MQVGVARHSPLVAAFAAELDALLLSSLPTTIAVALSGGVDSMACALLAAEWAAARGGRVVALTVDHGLRAESRAEAEQVAQWMQARGIAHHILTPEHRPAGNNRMQAARQWRYDALADWCRARDILHCLLAHHAGDQRETVLLHQARGETADGGSGMARLRHYRGVRFLRPLLTVEKADLQAYLRAREVRWVEDPSNQRTEFARVRMRKQLQQDPALMAQAEAIMAQQRPARIARELALAEAAMRCVTLHPAGFATLDRAQWRALAEPLQTQLLADTLRCISGATQRARRHEILALAAALRGDAPVKRSLQRCLIRARDAVMRIERELAHCAASLTLHGAGKVTWDQRFAVDYALPDGWALQLAPLGLRGAKLVGAAIYPPPTRVRSSTPPQGGSWTERVFSLLKQLPDSTPALWHGDEPVLLPAIDWRAAHLPATVACRIGFSPAKPLAAPAFW